MKESRTVEFKRGMTKSFLKTVSAFANYGGGDIFFGVDDEGVTVGVAEVRALCLDIENSINDDISPTPAYVLEESTENGLSIVVLHVREGSDKPYLYKGKAYRRSDTAAVEVDRTGLTRLILEGQHLSFEEIPARDQDLRFEESDNCERLPSVELY